MPRVRALKTALVIDDESVFRSTLRVLLNKRGWRVLEADGGESGLDILREQHPDVVICDLLMPKGNGYQMIRSIRGQQGKLSKTRVIITTSSPYEADRVTALAEGADAYLIKPVITSELLALLDQWIPSDPSAPTDTEAADQTQSSTMRVTFWGVRGSVPTPGSDTVHYGGNTSCVEIRVNGEIIVLDAGTGIRPLGTALATEFNGKPTHVTLLLTHTHWDHIQGFPFFKPAYNPKNTLSVLGYEGARKGLETTLSNQMESPYFPISLREMPGNITIKELKGMSFTIGSVQLTTAFANHPGVCVGYRLTTPHGSVVYMPDNELFMRLKAQQNQGEGEKTSDTQSFAKHQDQKLLEFIKGADVLILDSQYDEAEYKQRVGWGHSCMNDSVALAVAAGVRKFYMFHHDPEHSDARITEFVSLGRKLAAKLGNRTSVDAAAEGCTIELPLKPDAATP